MAEEIYESKELLKKDINKDNPDSTLDLIRQVLDTKDDSKMKLFVLGEILTKNKNDTIYELKGNIISLNKRIKNQRDYINKLKKSQNKTRNQEKNIYDKIDREAYRKACESFDNNILPKKKIVVVKKPVKKY